MRIRPMENTYTASLARSVSVSENRRFEHQLYKTHIYRSKRGRSAVQLTRYQDWKAHVPDRASGRVAQAAKRRKNIAQRASARCACAYTSQPRRGGRSEPLPPLRG